MNNIKSKYIKFCEQNSDIPLFMQPWWLEVVCAKGHWEVCWVEEAGEVWAVLIVYKVKKFAWEVVMQPPLTPFSGIWMRDKHFSKLHQKYHHIKMIENQLIAQLPRSVFFLQNYHYRIQDGQPFYWQGFQLGTRYTYILPNLADLNVVYQELNDNTKRNIRKAQRLNIQVLRFEDDLGIFEEFYRINTLTFQRKGLKNPIDYALFKRLHEALVLRKQNMLYLAKDAQGNYISTLYLVYDKNTAYYLAGGIDERFEKNPSMFLLFWTAIQDAAQRVNVFDFEGSMLPEIEPVFRGFGAVQLPYLSVFKAQNRFWGAMNQLFKWFKS